MTETPHLIKPPKVSFYQKAKDSKKGKSYVLVCKIIKDKVEARLVTDLLIQDKKKEWDEKTNRFRNPMLEAMKTKIENDLNLIITKSILENKDLSPKQIVELYMPKRYELLWVWERYIVEIKKAEYDRGELTRESYMKYVYRLRTLTKVLSEIKEPKITLDRINTIFCRSLEKALHKIGNSNTIIKYAQDLINIMDFAVVNELMYRNPLNKQTFTIKPKRQGSISNLSEHEIGKLEALVLVSEPLSKARDFFLFLCYTGMRYSDGYSFDYQSDTIKEKGRIFIHKENKKTKLVFTAPLLPQAYELLQKHAFKMPAIRCDKLNRYLKEIGELAEIHKRLHSHLGRKTFANLMHNANNIDFDTTSKTLGHTTSAMTEKHYATENIKRQVVNATLHLAVEENFKKGGK